jgi:hypothetical protein
LRSVSKVTGLGVITLGVIADRNNIPVAKRPKSIYSDIERAIWRKLVLGVSTQVIADQFSISVGAVEIILRKHPYLIRLRNRIRFFNNRQEHRNQIESSVSAHPELSRQQLRSKHSNSYAWLYKHDKQWLYETLPPAIPRNQRHTKQHDNNFAKNSRTLDVSMIKEVNNETD